MNDNVDHPAHYTQDRFGIECIEIIRLEVKTLADVVKYVWRHRERNGVEDLRKAERYLVWAMEDGVSLTGTAQSKIWQHVEPVVAKMTAPADQIYRVILDLAYGYLHTALSRLRSTIADWPTMTAPLPDGSTMVRRHGRVEREYPDGRVVAWKDDAPDPVWSIHVGPETTVLAPEAAALGESLRRRFDGLVHVECRVGGRLEHVWNDETGECTACGALCPHLSVAVAIPGKPALCLTCGVER